MANFLKETISDIKSFGHWSDDTDIVFIGSDDQEWEVPNWSEFERLADFELDGYGYVEAPMSLIIVFRNGDQMKRYRDEYDGMYYWNLIRAWKRTEVGKTPMTLHAWDWDYIEEDDK